MATEDLQHPERKKSINKEVDRASAQGTTGVRMKNIYELQADVTLQSVRLYRFYNINISTDISKINNLNYFVFL